MSYAALFAQRLRSNTQPLSDHDRLQLARMIESMEHDLARSTATLHHVVHLLDRYGMHIEPGADLTLVIPRLLEIALAGERT